MKTTTERLLELKQLLKKALHTKTYEELQNHDLYLKSRATELLDGTEFEMVDTKDGRVYQTLHQVHSTTRVIRLKDDHEVQIWEDCTDWPVDDLPWTSWIEGRRFMARKLHDYMDTLDRVNELMNR